MQGVRFLGNSKVEIAELPDPTPAEDEVLIRTKATGICGSELKAYRGADPMPTNAGHEIAGVIEDPNGHPQWQKGDEVVIFTIQGCGRCRWCRQKKDDFCSDIMKIGGWHAEFCTARATGMERKPEDISFPIAVLLGGDGLGVPYGASTRAGVQEGDVTCVFGCGPVGLGMVMVQAFLGAWVIAVDVNEYRLGLAKKLGARHTLNPNDTPDVVNALKELVDGIGPDKSFEAAGKQPTLDWALAATRPEGIIVQVGHGPQTLNPQQLIAKRNLTIMGNWICHRGDYDGMLRMCRAGLQPERLITRIYPFREAAEAYERFAAGQEGKVILEY